MAEIELNVMTRPYPSRRIASIEKLSDRYTKYQRYQYTGVLLLLITICFVVWQF